MSAVVKPRSISQVEGAVRLWLPSDWDGPSGVVVEVDGRANRQILLTVVLTAIREAASSDLDADQEAVKIARMTCLAMLGGAP